MISIREEITIATPPDELWPMLADPAIVAYPFGGSTIKLVQQIGYVHAMDLLLTARLIDAEQAAQLGLVNRLVPAGELMGWAIETAEMIAANSPSAVQAVKRQVSATIAAHVLTREAMEQQLGDAVRSACSSDCSLPPPPGGLCARKAWLHENDKSCT
jgi:enoyl-CoA hydratase/carnithine racemase